MAQDASAAACCAEFYEQDWVRALLGDSFHPGGEALSCRVINDAEPRQSDHVLDLACGTGTTALVVHDDYGAGVTGLDYSKRNVERARLRAVGREGVWFEQGSADALPFDDATFDVVLCECAVSTFGDKEQVSREVVRVLKSGGRLAISDMAVYCSLPDDLAAFGRGWSCVDDALTLEGYRDLFVSAGLTLHSMVDESDALHDMLLLLKKRLLMMGLGQIAGVLEGMDMDLVTLRAMLARAKTLVDTGRVRYGRLSFRR